MKVLHIISGDLMAGAEVMAYSLISAQVSRPGQNVAAVVLNHGRLADKLANLGIELLVLEESRQSGITLFHAIRSFIRQYQPTIVHTHRLKENILGGSAARLYRIPSIRTVHGATEHRIPWFRLDKRLLNAFDSSIAQHLQFCSVAVSDDLAKRMAGQYPRRKLEVIPNGLDASDVRSRSLEFKPTKNTAQTRFIFLGRLVPVKGVERLLRAARLYSALPERDFELLIVGDGPLRRELTSEINNLGLENRVQLLGHLDNPLPWLVSSNSLMLASDHEGMPMCVLEALALGVPVIAPRLGGIESVLNTSNSVLIDEPTPEALASAMAEIDGRREDWQITLPNSCSSVAMEQAYFNVYSRALNE